MISNGCPLEAGTLVVVHIRGQEAEHGGGVDTVVLVEEAPARAALHTWTRSRSQTNKHVGLKYGLLFLSFSCDILVSTVTICLTCARSLCVRRLLMSLISDIVSLLLLIIRPNHWLSLRSFIPPCNQRQFVTMPNEKIPVSSGSYLPITRCLTVAPWPA